MTSPQSPSFRLLQQRVSLLEQRFADLENSFGSTLYDLHRRAVRTDLTLDRIATHLGIAAPTDEEVDAAIEDADPTTDNA